MTKITKSDYVKISRTIVIRLYRANCFGKGSLYYETLKKGFNQEYINKVETVLEALVKQKICIKKKKLHGWNYYLNSDRLDKIKEIIREKGDKSVILLILSF
ncbi:hypothetical protein ACFL0W_00870 [Nanoarchaeota archaeon]